MWGKALCLEISKPAKKDIVGLREGRARSCQNFVSFRFMYGNKEMIQAKREEIGKLKDQMSALQQQLEK